MGYITLAPLKRLMEKSGAKHVSKEAVEKLADFLEKRTFEMCQKSQELAEYSGRSTVMKKDVRLVKKSKVI